MKSIKFIVTAILAVTASVFTFGQTQDQPVTTKTESIKVGGKCEMCKARIEKTAKIDGVSKAEWNINTGILTLTYNPSVVASDDVQKKIASVGHDTEKFKASEATYKSLAGCCKYDRMK